jgi:LEA14-like dessication related protein
MKKIVLVAVTGLVALVLTGCVSPEPPKVEHTGTTFTPVSLQEVRADSTFSIKNSNPVALQGSLDYELIINGSSFSSGRSNTIDVGASGQNTFTITSKIDLVKAFGVMTDLVSAVNSGKKSIPYQLKGTFRTNVLGGIAVETPVTASGELPLPEPTSRQTLDSIIKSLLK